MKRTTIWLTESQLQKLGAGSKKTGLKIAELIRRFIDLGLKGHK
jgi:Ribbon-helix-helix domain